MDPNLIVAIVSVFVGSAIGVSSNFWYRKQFESNKKQHQIQGLLEAFRILDKENHREFRKTVFALYFEYFEKGDVNIFKHQTVAKQVANVMADFDVLGKLVHSENIDKIEFLEEYGSLAYRCWRCLEDHVSAERDQRNFPPFMTWFQWLAREGYYYWKHHEPKGYDLDDTDLFHPDDSERKISFKNKPIKKTIGSPI